MTIILPQDATDVIRKQLQDMPDNITVRRLLESQSLTFELRYRRAEDDLFWVIRGDIVLVFPYNRCPHLITYCFAVGLMKDAVTTAVQAFTDRLWQILGGSGD